MKAVQLAFATVALSLCAAAPALAEELEVKGLRFGMTEADFKKINPRAQCDFTARKTGWDSTVPKRRTCSVPGFALATKRAEESQFLFYEGRLGSWNATFAPSDWSHIQEALTGRFGSPLPAPHFNGIIWKVDATNLRLVPAGQSLLVNADSILEEVWQQKLRAFERRRKSDL